jgi:hypothetical protein
MKTLLCTLTLSASLFAACADDSVALPCNIAKRGCQQAVFAVTAEVRGQKDAKIPPIRVISRKQLAAEIKEGSANQTPKPDTTAMEQAYALLGMLPAKAGSAGDALDSDLADSIAAYYSPGAKAITVVSDSAGSDEDGTFVLSHEYTHALQDQRNELVYPSGTSTTDAQVAFDALTEGEAVWISNLTMFQIEGRSPAADAVEKYFDQMTGDFLEQIGGTTAPLYLAGEVLPYPLGGRGVYHAYRDKDLPGIHALHTKVPTTVSFWLDLTPKASDTVMCALPAAPTNYKVIEDDRLGTVGMVAFDAGSAGATKLPPTLELADGWLDDRVATYTTTDHKQVALAWRVLFRDEKTAQTFEALLMGHAKTHVVRDAKEVFVAAASDEKLLDTWTGLDDCTAPAMDKTRRAAWATVEHRRPTFMQ